MPSTRDLVSGRDFQLRYALHRLTLLALGADPLYDRAAVMRLEWPLSVERGEVPVDVLLEDESGGVLEIVECKEHKEHIDPKSVRKFFADVARLAPIAPEARFRFVTNARHLPDGTRPWRLEEPPVAQERIEWELDTPNKESLAAECIAHFARGAADPFSLYARLYARLASQMAARLRREGHIFVAAIRDVHAWLFSDIDPERLSANLSLPGEPSFAVAELRGILERNRSPRKRALDASRKTVALSTTTALLSDSSVTLEQIFIDPVASAQVYESESDWTAFTDPALSLLFQWLATSRTKGAGRLAGRLGAGKPLLLLGPFGFGKTSLLAMFAERLLALDSSIVPIFIRLRTLRPVGTVIPLIDALRQHVRDTHGLDIDTCEEEICLLADGFDELNLFFTGGDQAAWVEDAYLQLAFLAHRPNITVIISSRPILFIASDAVARDGATRVNLREFDDGRIRRWCERYRESAGLSGDLSLDFLAERDLVEVARTPIVLYMIARIFETQPEMLEAKRYTRAEIYRLFINWTEKGRYHTDDKKHELPRNYREILQEIAWLLFQSGRGAVAERELLESLRETFGASVDRIPIDRNILVAHMLRTTSDERDSGDLIEFTHQSFREYLVAERIWRLLAPVRAGQPLQAETWISLAGRVLTEAKIELLLDMVRALPAAEAEALYRGLEQADNVHQYWAKWSAPVWDRWSAGRVRDWFATLPSRAAGLTVLAFVLRVAAYKRCADAAGSEPDLEPPRTDTFQRLVSFLQSFPDAGVAKDAETLLLQNLRGLRLGEVSSLTGLSLEGADLTESRLANINFEGSSLAGVITAWAIFKSCSFSRTIFQPTAFDTTFEDCDFTSARILLGDLKEDSALRFLNCRFDYAIFDGLELRGATFQGCVFTGVAVLRPPSPVLIDCTLDARARAFFRKMRVRVGRS